MINCLIVDDEPLAREILRLHLTGIPGWTIVAECMNAAEAFEKLLSHKIDLMFLDVQMPRINGTDFLRNIKDPPGVIFTTAHAGFAIEGFELNAIDYLLKPITRPRFLEAIRKAEVQLGVRRQVPPVNPELPQDDSYIFVKQDNRQIKVQFEDILFLEAKRDYTLIQLKDRKVLAGFNLKMLEGMLPANLFLRIHRSYIVRLSAIDALYGNLVEIRTFQVPVSLAHKEALMQALRLS